MNNEFNGSRDKKLPFTSTIAICLLAACPAIALAQSAAPVLVAEFAGNLNTKSAKVGDALPAKTLKPSKLSDGTVVPKGSQLIGTVVAVQSKQAGNGTSNLAIKFDRLQLKDGASQPIHGRIAAIGNVSGVGGDPTDGSLMARGGPSATSGLSPQSGSPTDSSDNPGAPDAVGSTLKGVILALHLDDAGANHLEGVNIEIKLNSAVMIKVILE
jgi:hypothetical protein